MSGTARVSAVLDDTPYRVMISDDLGHLWEADEPANLGGANVGPAPDRLLLGSLAACTAITLKMVAARKAWPLAGLRVELALNPEGKPAAGSDITLQLVLEGDLDEVQRAELLRIATRCPMHRLLTGEVRIHTRLG